jgi:hypothetical protein
LSQFLEDVAAGKVDKFHDEEKEKEEQSKQQ